MSAKRGHLEQATSAPPQAKAAEASERTPVLDALVTSYIGRKIDAFHKPGSLLQAAKALINTQHVVLMTGFSVAENKPETDGPPGTAALGHALKELGKALDRKIVVSYVTDPANTPVLKAAVAALDPEAAKYARFVTFDAAHGASAAPAANALLDTLKPDAVVAIELPSRSADGSRHNMRGVNIDPFNGPVDEILIQANERKLITVGIGDGGNEAGMGGLKGIPKATDGSEMAAVVKAQYPVTAWNSNFGAEALGAVLLQLGGKLDALHTPEQQAAMIDATFKAGAVDGVSHKKAPSGLDADGRGGGGGVDGFPPLVHGGMLTMLKSVVAGEIKPGFVAKKTPDQEGPFLVAMFDSSNGGLIAAHDVQGFIDHRSTFPVRLVVMGDHGNAPYGPKSRGELVLLVGHALKRAEEIGVDVIAMACNTACTAFAEPGSGLDDARDGLKKPGAVLDLIDVTAKAIAKKGGGKPVIFSTEATANAAAYPNKVRAATGGRIAQLEAFGRPEWAPMVNALQHLETASASDKKAVDDSITKYAADVPKDATSLWLCCTHYPALQGRIQEALDKSRDAAKLPRIPVINPMEYQAEAIDEYLREMAATTDRSNRNPRLATIVLTTGNLSHEVEKSARDLFTRNGAAPPPVLYYRFDRTFSMELLGPELFKPAKSSPTTDVEASASGSGSKRKFTAGTDTPKSPEKRQTSPGLQ